MTSGRQAIAPLARSGRWLCAVAALCGAAAHAGSLDPATQQKIRAATFEVVMAKPDEGSVAYEKPLPLELLPYQVRNDRYNSIGTAFAIGDHRFVTAAHVLSAGIISQFGAPSLRDASGKVYPIDQILKYSVSRDFAVFTVTDEPQVQPLEAGPHAAPGEAVYAVGNALGEGVVIRDGLFTSETPEERDGKWNWLRFSAAASPGNSGGPLLGQDGKVIGVVLRKSPEENLNYALPIEELLQARDSAVLFDNRTAYQLDVFDFVQPGRFDKEIALPKSYPEFSRAYADLWHAYEDRQLQDLLNLHAQQTFPRGKGSIELLHTIQGGNSPGLLMRQPGGRWEARRPDRDGYADLGNSGFVAVAHVNKISLLHIRRPDDVPAEQFYGDSRTYMDTLLKAEAMTRTVGEEKVRVVSLGQAQRDATLIDGYQRKWQLRQWPIPYADAVVVSLALPVPDGYVALVRTVPTRQLHANFNDFRALANFVDVSYRGTLAQWQQFGKMTAWLPPALQAISIEYDPGKSLRYTSPRLSLVYTPAVQPIGPDSELYLDFSFFDDHGDTVWDVARIVATVDAHTRTRFSVSRNMEPDPEMSQASRDQWAQIARHYHPYDGMEVVENDLSSIQAVHPATDTSWHAVLYTVRVENDGVASQEAMHARLDQLMQELTIKDERAPF